MLEVMAGYDPTDPSAAQVAVPKYSEALTGDISDIKMALPMPYFFDHEMLDPEMRTAVLAAVDVMTGLGATKTETELKYSEEAKDANYLILVAEAYAYHRDNLQKRWSDYGRFTRPSLARGALFTAADLSQAQRFRTKYSMDVAALFLEHDVIVTPSAAFPAERSNAMSVSKRLLQPSYTGHWNLTGLPAIAIPVGFTESGLPLSMQIIGKPFAEETVLRVADAYQRATDFHLQVPQTDALETTDSVVMA